MRNYYLFILIALFSFPAFAQLSNFTLQVTSTNESCTANGVLTFAVANATAGATMVFRVYRLPDVINPIATQSALTLTGLTAGDYKVVAIQSLGSESGSQTVNKTIVSTIIPLMYSVQTSPTLCGNDGEIDIQVASSNAVSYEIFIGPVTRPLQSSPTFTGLPAGSYSVRAFDACGEGVAHTCTIQALTPSITINNPQGSIQDCSTFSLGNSFGGAIAYPIVVHVTVFMPTGPPLVFTSAALNSQYYYVDVPLLGSGQSYTYSVSVTDACGNTFTRNNMQIAVPSLSVVFDTVNAAGCSAAATLVVGTEYAINPITISFTASPAGFNPVLNNPNHPGPFYSSASYSGGAIPTGTYSVLVTDSCGRTATASANVTIPSHQPATLYYSVLGSCQAGYGSILVGTSSGVDIVSAQLTAAPASYPIPLPQNLAPYLTPDGDIKMGHLLPGIYTITTVDVCGDAATIDAQVTGYVPGITTATVTENCDSFNLFLDNQSNFFGYYFLQKINASGQWGHPSTGNTGTPGVYDYQNAVQIYNGANYNLPYSGQFRIVKYLPVFSDGSAEIPRCYTIIYSFEFIVGPKIINAYTFQCTPTASDVIVVGQGVAPLTYRITTKNGQPFAINNGNSAVFLGLEPAIYNFQLEDACGNILNRVFDITIPVHLEITTTGFCSGGQGSLTLPDFSFLSYSWWKGDDPSNVVSTTNTLTFSPYVSSVDDGMYHVRVQYPAPNSCIDFTLDYNVSGLGYPVSGTGSTVAYCDRPESIDLYSLLVGAFDTGGHWQDNDASGTLSGHMWSATGLTPGTYHLRYDVTNSCGNNHTTVTIILKPAPEPPVITTPDTICAGGIINLDAGHAGGTAYHWEGPNGFTSDDPQPQISNATAAMSGNYTVLATVGDCTSEIVSMHIAVDPVPDFSMAGGCAENKFLLTVVPRNNSFDATTASYSWQGPSGFASDVNPTDISYLPAGAYFVEVTNAEGCSAQQSIDVPNTFCDIAAGISPNGDGKNDYLNLAGLDALKLEIFSRYGRLVYEHDNYIDQWHGQDYNDRQLPDATYYYYIALSDGREMTGWVYVTR